MRIQKNYTRTLLFIGLVLVAAATSAQDPNFHIYLCFGQSNMEGQGLYESRDKTVIDRFLVLQAMDCKHLEREKAIWYPAIPPLCHCSSGLSPADYFGRTMVANSPDSIRIGVIVVAVGGCDIRLFDKDIHTEYHSTYTQRWFTDKLKAYDNNPYEYMIDLARIAQQDGVIKGILLHQGETNTGDEQWPHYVSTVYNNMLDDLGLQSEHVPLLAGELVHEEQEGCCSTMNPIIARLPEVVPSAHVISSRGCAIKDPAHFSAAGYRELGKRYAQKMLELMGEQF